MNLDDFKKEFSHVYEWSDIPNTEYPEHFHKGKVSMYIVQGRVTFFFPENKEIKTITTGERFDVPVGVAHTAKVGEEGCDYIVGEMIEGDS